MGRPHPLIPAGEFGLLGQPFQLLDQNGALRQPEREAGTDILVEGEELQLLAQLAVIALLRLLDHGEVVVELLLGREGDPVDPLQLRIPLVALVIGAGDVGQLERADPAGIGDMGPGAEIDESAVGIKTDRRPLGNVLKNIELELARLGPLAQGRQPSGAGQHLRLGPAHLGTDERLPRLLDRGHLLLDPGEIVRADPVGQLDVIIESLLHRRTGGELGLRPKFKQSGSQDVGSRMANRFEFVHEKGKSRTEIVRGRDWLRQPSD